MKKADITRTLQSKEVRDYTYAIMFFLVSAFFAVFVIRPVLTIALSIQRQAKDLEVVNAKYEQNITKVLELQADLEGIRSRKHLIDEALPSQPHIDRVIADIQTAAAATNVTLTNVTIKPIDLKPADDVPALAPEDAALRATIRLSAPFRDVEAFLRAIGQQRRVKSMGNMSMAVGTAGEGDSIILSLDIELESYYAASVPQASDTVEQSIVQ